MDVHINLIGRRNLSGEIYRQLRYAITEGRLRPGDCLPASRDLARSLQVSRTTVTVAYDRLAGEGFVVTRVGAGTYVSCHIATESKKPRKAGVDSSLRPRAMWDSIYVSNAFAQPARFDFRTGLPDASLFPHQNWRRLMNRELRRESLSMGVYAQAAGHRLLREAIARHIAVSRGVQTSPDEVTITSGAQQAIDVVARVLLEPRDEVAMEDPGYPVPRLLFESLGMRVRGVPVDEQGIVVDAIPRAARLVYVTPSHQYPLGVTMSLPRRLALLDWAARNNAAIVEDDYDSEFRFEERPIEPLQTLDTTGRVIYVGSFSKTLLPTLRLGFVVTPSSCTTAVHRAKYVTDWHTSMLAQGALARFINDGSFARHLRKMNRVYRERHELVKKIITKDFADHLELIPSVAGLHMAAVARCASAEEIDRVLDQAAERDVAVQSLAKFAVDAMRRPGLMIGYGAIATGDIQEGMKRLRECF